MSLIQPNGLSGSSEEANMTTVLWKEQLVEETVTYTLLKDGKFYIIENVPARVNVETGEQYFAPDTVERIQQIIWGQRPPVRVVQTPIYEFATSN